MIPRRTARHLIAASLALTVLACQDGEMVSPPVVEPPSFAKLDANEDVAAAISDQMDAINAGLAADGADYRVAMAEYITGGDEAGATVVRKDVGNKRLSLDFVPNDERRTWSGAPGGTTDDITYAIDQGPDAVPPIGGLTGGQATAAIQSAMATWDAERCSDLSLVQNPDFGIDIGVVAFLNGLGGSPFVFADVQHAGFRDIDFAGGVLGVAFTFQFIDNNGDPTDIDDNGRLDVAFREIYYDPDWTWSLDGAPGTVDVESIALHEAGHGLSQAHFGNIFFKKGVFSPSPRAVMNAFYGGGQQQTLLGTDRGGHCGNWAQWPQN